MRKVNSGFTLVEVMVAMVIMAGMTVLISQTIRSSINNKQKIETRMTNTSMLYDSLSVLKLDIERAFHYQDVFFEIEELAIQQLENEKKKGGSAGGADNSPPGPARRPPPKLTQFLGDEKSLHFTSLNHFRTKYNAKESDQMEVGYFVDSCKSRKGDKSTKCLWRRNALIIDDEVEKGGNKVVVAEHVTDFKLSYRGNRENDEWLKQWRSDNKGKNIHRNKFPHQVRVELALHDTTNKKNHPVKQTMVVNIQFPNNESLLSPETPTKATN